MRIKSIQLDNIRCFSSLTLDLDRQVTLVFGMNGVGKSTIIDALAAALSPIPGLGATRPLNESDLRIETARAGGSFRRERVREGSLAVTVALEEQVWTWSLTLTRGKEAVLTGDHLEFAEAIQQRISDKRTKPAAKDARVLPVVAVYSAQRGWLDHPRNGEPVVGRLGRLAGYHGALDAGTDLAHLRAWWRDQDHHRKSDLETPVLDAVEVAVASFLGSEVALPSYSLDERDIMVELPNTRDRMTLRELSDGYRGMVALVADIARRMAQLNPEYNDDLLRRTPGLVAIDEIDLHLHPIWQREVLPRLRETFPRVQFVVTSHSPQVLASLHDNHEFVGISTAGEIWTGGAVVGRDSNSILEEIMGATQRPPAHQEKLDAFYKHVTREDFDGARVLLAELESDWGYDDADLVQARWSLDAEDV